MCLRPALKTYFPKIAWSWVLAAAPTQTNASLSYLRKRLWTLRDPDRPSAIVRAFPEGDRGPNFQPKRRSMPTGTKLPWKYLIPSRISHLRPVQVHS